MRTIIAIGWVLTLACAAPAQTSQSQESPPEFTPEQIRTGAALFERHCAPCHGSHMADPEAAFNLRTFPHDQHVRFVESVTKGKNSMPPWGSLLKPEDIEALWAYVVAGEKPADGARTDDSKADSSKTDSSKTEGSKSGASKPDDSKAEASKADAPKSAKKNPDSAKAADRARPEH